MNAPFAPAETNDIQLRVLNGRLAGAEHRLFKGKHIRIGHGFDNDVVLRGVATKGLALELHLAGDTALIRVVSGAVLLLGRPVGAGEEAVLPLYVPVRVGEYGFAIGSDDDDRWAEARHLLDAASIVPNMGQTAGGSIAEGGVTTPPLAPEDDAHKPRADWLERLGTRFYAPGTTDQLRRNWPVGAAALAILLLIGLAIGPAVQWTRGQLGGVEAARETLAAAGFRNLRVKDDRVSGNVLVQGVVRDDKALGQLKALASSRLEGAVIDVKTWDGLAAAATDLLQAQNVDAEARPGRNGTMIVQSEFLPGDRQEELSSLIRRELVDVRAVSFNLTAARGDQALQYFFAGKHGVATFVDGDPGFIATADQARWFPGADLPTGHKLISIANGRARFERNGVVEEIVFGDALAAPETASQTTESPTEGRTKL